MRELVQEADLILVMELGQCWKVLRQYPDARGKVLQLGQLNGRKPAEIMDPYGGTFEDFEACYAVIRMSCDNLLQHLAETE